MSDKTLIKLLEMLDTEMAQRMLADLQSEDRRTPQLYNAIGKLLDRHKFQVSKLTPDADILGELAGSLSEYNSVMDDTGLSDEDLYKAH